MARRAAPGAAVELILGEDSYLAEQALERILQRTVGAERADGVTLLYGDEVRWEAVLAAARAGSLFASRRAVVVRRADLLRFAASQSADDDAGAEKGARAARGEADAVCRYLEEPSPDVTLVLLAAKPDRRRNPWKRLSVEAEIHSAEPKKGRVLRSYVEDELRRRGLRLAGEAVQELIDEVGQDLRRLMGELDKLEAWGEGQKGALSADEVHAILGRGLGRPLYLLADAAAARNLAGALGRLHELLEGGEEGLRILTALHRSLRQVRAAAAMREAGAPRTEIGARLLPPHMQFKLDALLEAARRWDEPALRSALAALDEADRRIKVGADPATALSVALLRSCRGAGPPSTSSRRGL